MQIRLNRFQAGFVEMRRALRNFLYSYDATHEIHIKLREYTRSILKSSEFQNNAGKSRHASTRPSKNFNLI